MKIKNFSLGIATLLLLVFSSCKKDTVDVTDLLRSVPSSAAGVVVLNLESIVEDAGCKIKGHEITPGKEVRNLLDKFSEKNNKEDFKLLFEGESGIEPKGAVVFYDSNRTYLTFALYDAKQFLEFIEIKTGNKFEETNSGVKVNGNVAIKGTQAWILISAGKQIDTDAIASYSSLKDSQSFLVTPNGETLLVEENDIRGWALINTFLENFVSRQDRGMFTLGLGFLFEDAESLKFKVDFKKGELESEMIVLNDKGKPAKYQLPSDKVDVNTLKSLGESCDAMMAFTVNSKLIKKFDQISSAFGGALFGDLTETLKNIDGTVGLVASGQGLGESVNGVITTKGELSKTLRDLISEQVSPVSVDGKYLRFSKGDVKGALSVAECAEELKGSCLGFVMDASGMGTVGYDANVPSDFKSVVIKFKPESGGLELDMEIKTSDPKENVLMTLLKNLK